MIIQSEPDQPKPISFQDSEAIYTDLLMMAENIREHPWSNSMTSNDSRKVSTIVANLQDLANIVYKASHIISSQEAADVY